MSIIERYHKIFDKEILQKSRGVIFSFSPLQDQFIYQPYSHNISADSVEKLGELMRHNLFFYSYGEEEVVQHYEKDHFSSLEQAAKYEYINRLPKRAGITDGLPSEVLLDLLVQLYNPQACKLAVRTILRQNDNNETPAKAIEYSNKLSDNMGALRAFDAYPDDFKTFLSHIQKEYDIDHSVDEWSLIKVLQNGFGMHHGKLPKYIQQEILDQFNKGTFDVLFCTSTIVEGVNTDAQNMIILNASKGSKKLTPFDIKNIKGRAGRYYHCFIGRVFYMTKELQKIEDSDSMTLNFVTYSDNELSVIDLDNAEIEDLTSINAQRKMERETVTQQFVLPQEVFFKNRTISKENQEILLHLLMTDSEFSKYSPLLTHAVDVDGFLHYRWINKILNTFYNASLIDEITCKKFSAIANNYYEGGFKALLGYEVGKYRRGHYKSMDRAYSEAFKSLKDVLEHKIPKILSLFESIVVFVAKQGGIGVETFSLSRVRRYYETGVKSLLGEALIEYGFPTDAIRRIEENHKKIKSMTVSEAKEYCRLHFREVQLLLDTYERSLFIKAMRTF